MGVQKVDQARPGIRGPVVVWLFVLCYWALVSIIFHGSSSSSAQLPSSLTSSVFFGLTASVLLQYGPILLFLFLFVRLYERRRGRGLLALFSGVGWNRVGVRSSLKWALVFFVVAIPVGLLMLLVESAVAGIGAEHVAGSTSSTAIPSWYIPFAIVSLAADVVTEETVVRGYIFDRLMPAHPSSLRQSLTAVLITSLMMSSYHLVPYLYTYGYGVALTGVNFLADFLYSVLICFAYVKSKTRNISGPLLFHFFLDLPLLLGV
jgi:hypothetical protein